MSIEDSVAHNNSIVGKSFHYWQHLYNEDIIESHVIDLRLQHLKYALDHKLIVNKEYYRTQKPSTIQCDINYKPCSLIDFVKALKVHNSTSQLEIIQLSKMNQPLEKMYNTQKPIKSITENNKEKHKVSDNSNSYPIIEEECIINQTITKKKSRKNRKKKKNSINTWENINNNVNTKAEKHFKDEYLKVSENSPKQNLALKHPVKIFVRQANKKYKSNTICTKPLISSKKKTVRDIFSAILKQYKMERQNQLHG